MGREKIISIPNPSYEDVEGRLKEWNSNEKYVEMERLLDTLFTETYPLNKNVEEVKEKVRRLNTGYRTRMSNFEMDAISEHIVSLQIDERIRNGDLDIVNEIADINGKRRYSFASKYCAFHFPEKYALYDYHADSTLWYFQNKHHFSEFKRYNLKDYTLYMKVIEDFKKRYNLEAVGFRNLDHYLWYTGYDILNKNNN